MNDVSYGCLATAEGSSEICSKSKSGTLWVKKNPVKRPSSPVPLLPAQWLEHPTGVSEVVCSISAWNAVKIVCC